jgi:selT/selW/selH-like putative selenoprotein
LSAAIRQAHGNKVQVETQRGDGGIFDVAIDGEMVYRKWDTGQFPTNAEILAQIDARLRKA